MTDTKSNQARRSGAKAQATPGRPKSGGLPGLRPRRGNAKATKRRIIPERKEPPVLARGYSASVAVPTRRTVKPRRRYDVALSAPGAEMRLPSLPRVRFGWRFISFFLTLGLAGLVYGIWTAPQFQARGAEVLGLQRLTSREVNSVLDIAGEPIFTLDRQALERRLLAAFPEFKSVAVEIELPNRVHVQVVERVPQLVWQQDNRLLLVDEEGMAFPARNAQAGLPGVQVLANSLPLLDSGKAALEEDVLEAVAQAGAAPALPTSRLQAQELIRPELVAAIVAVAERAPAGAPLIFDEVHGLGWNDPAGWTVYLGTADKVEMKLAVYQALVDHLTSQQVQASLISVEFVHAPYYRLQPEE